MGDAGISATPDIHSSTDEYAQRFAGSIGAWMIDVQQGATQRLIQHQEIKAAVDFGGGHGQNILPLKQNNIPLTIVGSDSSCQNRVSEFIEQDRVAFKAQPLVGTDFCDQQYDLVISYRMLAHIDNWQGLVKELCRTSSSSVLVDYPVWRSANILTSLTFGMKKKLEGNTRRFRIFHEKDLVAAFEEHGFILKQKVPQFFWPMAIHRMHRNPLLGRCLEAIPRFLGLTAFFGSPVIACFERKNHR